VKIIKWLLHAEKQEVGVAHYYFDHDDDHKHPAAFRVINLDQ
jgi:hypothetical protein